MTSDFVGLARKKRQADEPDTTHVYFTGCSGNVAAGKYNDGTPEARVRLTQRMYEGMVDSERTLERRPVERVAWSAEPILLAPNPAFTAEMLQQQIMNKSNAVAGRSRPAFTLAFLKRCEQKIPIVLSALHIDDVTLLHLPAESFVEYQLRAQQAAPSRFVATAAYGDGGPWYIPVKEAYPQGGYEASVAFSSDATDQRMTDGSRKLVS